MAHEQHNHEHGPEMTALQTATTQELVRELAARCSEIIVLGRTLAEPEDVFIRECGVIATQLGLLEIGRNHLLGCRP